MMRQLASSVDSKRAGRREDFFWSRPRQIQIRRISVFHHTAHRTETSDYSHKFEIFKVLGGLAAI
jgi:hypothetical protein